MPACGREERNVGPIRSISTFHLHLGVPLIRFAGILRGVSPKKRRSRGHTRKCYEIDSPSLVALLWVPCLPPLFHKLREKIVPLPPSPRIASRQQPPMCHVSHGIRPGALTCPRGPCPGGNRTSDTLLSTFPGVEHSSSQLPEMDCIGEESAIFEDVFCLCDVALLSCCCSSMERIQKQVQVGSASIRKELLLASSWRHLSQHHAAMSVLLGLWRPGID